MTEIPLGHEFCWFQGMQINHEAGAVFSSLPPLGSEDVFLQGRAGLCCELAVDKLEVTLV